MIFFFQSHFSPQPWFKEMKKVSLAFPYWENWHAHANTLMAKKLNYPSYSMFYPINEDLPGKTSYLEFEIDIGHFFSKSSKLASSKAGLLLHWIGMINSYILQMKQLHLLRASLIIPPSKIGSLFGTEWKLNLLR